MPLNKWEEMLGKIKDHPLEECKLMGMGEPFLHPEFDGVTKVFKEVFPSCRVIVATNCQYDIGDTSKMKRRFQDSLEYIDVLYLSIDGYKASYERDRSPAKWDKLIKFLNDLQNIDRKGCQIVINYVVNKENLKDIPKIQEFLSKYNLSELRLNIAQDWSQDKSVQSNENTWGYTEEQLEYLKTFRSLIKGKSPWSWNDCFWPKNGLYTTVEGNVKMCCLNTGAKPFGNLFKDSLQEIRKSSRYAEIAKQCGEDKKSDHCKNCSYKELSPLLGELGVGG